MARSYRPANYMLSTGSDTDFRSILICRILILYYLLFICIYKQVYCKKCNVLISEGTVSHRACIVYYWRIRTDEHTVSQQHQHNTLYRICRRRRVLRLRANAIQKRINYFNTVR